jgi:hypothetical protein
MRDAASASAVQMQVKNPNSVVCCGCMIVSSEAVAVADEVSARREGGSPPLSFQRSDKASKCRACSASISPLSCRNSRTWWMDVSK